jgi:hypothetical protein
MRTSHRPEARKLAAALTELADWAEGGNAD